MKNPDIITFIGLVQDKTPLVFIENDTKLSDSDLDIIDNAIYHDDLYIKDFNIVKWQFDAFSNKDTFSLLETSKNIMVVSSFIGESYYMLQNFISMCEVKNLSDKKIFTFVNKRSLHFDDDIESRISKLDLERNISLYCVPRDKFRCFEKFCI